MYGERTPYIHRHVVCVCVYVSQSKRENPPFPQEGIEWPYIHKGENHPVPQRGGGRVLLPPWPGRGGGDAQNRGGGGGDAAEAQGKTAGDILFHRDTMVSPPL